MLSISSHRCAGGQADGGYLCNILASEYRSYSADVNVEIYASVTLENVEVWGMDEISIERPQLRPVGLLFEERFTRDAGDDDWVMHSASIPLSTFM